MRKRSKNRFNFIKFFFGLGSISRFRSIIRGNIVVLMLLEILNGLSRWALLPSLQPYMLNVGYSIVFIGALSSFRSIISAIFQPLLGRYSDIKGRKPVIIFGSILKVAALLLISLIEDSTLLVLSFIILGVAESFVTPTYNALMMESVEKEFRTTAYGLIKTVTFGMGILAPIFGGFLTILYGFQMGFVFLTIVCLVNSIAYALLLKETVSNINKTATIGILTRVRKLEKKAIIAELKSFFIPESNLRGLYTIWALDSFAWGAFIPIRSAILADYFKLSTNMIGIVLAISSAVVTFSVIPLSSLADRIDRRTVICISEIFAGLSLVGYIFSSNFTHVIFIQIFNGIALASWVGPILSLLADAVPQNTLGVATGRLFAIGTIAGLPSPVLGGLIYSYFGFRYLCLFCLILVIINILLIPIVIQEAREV